MWCIPPDQNTAFVAAMEDVLEVYSRAYNTDIPVVCMDEQPIEFHADSRETIRLKQLLLEFKKQYGQKFPEKLNTNVVL